MGHGEACFYAYGNDLVEERLMIEDRGDNIRAQKVDKATSGELSLVRAGGAFSTVTGRTTGRGAQTLADRHLSGGKMKDSLGNDFCFLYDLWAVLSVRSEVGLRELEKEHQCKIRIRVGGTESFYRHFPVLLDRDGHLHVVYKSKCPGKVDLCSVLQQCSSPQRHIRD